jgi:hypothetical protein
MALFPMVLVFSLILPTSVAVASAATPVSVDYPVARSILDWSGLTSTMVLNIPAAHVMPVVAASRSVELAKWDLFWAAS